MSRPAGVVARRALWTYRGESEEAGEIAFFAALEPAVAAEIASRHREGMPVAVGRELRLRVGSYGVRARLADLEPPLADLQDGSTLVLARHVGRAGDESQDVSAFVSEVIHYPDERFATAFEDLVGLGEIKADLVRKLTLVLAPGLVEEWAGRFAAGRLPAPLVRSLRDRHPLVILEGEVGSGKTSLAYATGQQLATVGLRSPVVLYVVNAQVRGGGHVGELTQNVSRAFAEAERCQEREAVPVVVLVDEADALAEARGRDHMHHEDSAGVNALIQRIDRLRGRPIAVVFATNMARSLDPAIVRRAMAVYHFDRPSAEQRAEVFRRLLTGLSLSNRDLEKLVSMTGPRRLSSLGPSGAEHRYTYSDLVQRVIPHAVEEALFAGEPMDVERLARACAAVWPTPETLFGSAERDC